MVNPMRSLAKLERVMRAGVNFAVSADCIRGTTDVPTLMRMTRPNTIEDEKKQ
jgi:hypothetical protein